MRKLFNEFFYQFFLGSMSTHSFFNESFSMTFNIIGYFRTWILNFKMRDMSGHVQKPKLIYANHMIDNVVSLREKLMCFSTEIIEIFQFSTNFVQNNSNQLNVLFPVWSITRSLLLCTAYLSELEEMLKYLLYYREKLKEPQQWFVSSVLPERKYSSVQLVIKTHDWS